MPNITWIGECCQAFKELKKFLLFPPLLSKPKMGAELYLYLTTSLKVISLILIWVDDKGIQRPIYYISQVIHDAKARYSKA